MNATRINEFLNREHSGYGRMRVTAREAQYIMRTHRPRTNNAPSLNWTGHFRVGNYGYSLCGLELTVTGCYEGAQ